MLDFPGFEKRVSEIRSQNSAAIDLAGRMFATWINQPIVDWLGKSDLPGVVLSLSYMLNSQASRQFRSVVELCKIGEGANANILGRCLFETVLAAHFILEESLDVVVEPNGGKEKWRARRHRDDEQCDPLSREKRALIFQAHCISQGYHVADGISERQLEATGDKLTLDPNVLAVAKTRIGKEWAYIQSQRPYTYSGLNVEQLADVVGHWFPRWYEAMYSDQSRNVHGVNPICYAFINTSTREVVPSWFSNDNTISEALWGANTLFMAFMSCLNNNIGLGDETDKALEVYFGELAQIYNSSPKEAG